MGLCVRVCVFVSIFKIVGLGVFGYGVERRVMGLCVMLCVLAARNLLSSTSLF